MRKQRQRKVWGLVALAALTLAACSDDVQQRQFSFNATVEQLVNADNNGSKVQLINEEWTYWEMYDSINLVSNASTGTGSGTRTCDLYTGWLVNGGGGDYSDYDGVFISTLTENEDYGTSKWFVAIHPANYQKHQITYNPDNGNHGFAAKVYLEPVQHYRHDSSYARQLLPMIASYDGPVWGSDPGQSADPYRLDFHALASLVRLQLVNGTGSANTIKKIELTSLDFASAPDAFDGTAKRPLCGRFPVNNLYRFNAHLAYYDKDHPYTLIFEAPSELGGSGDGYTLTLSTSENANEGNLRFNQNELLSFYVVLPAYHGMDTTTYFRLQMTVYDGNDKKCTKTFTVGTRRNGITYMRAINIDAFNESAGTGTPVLVGNGTSTRPFKIYTTDDLLYLRNCYNADTAVGTTRKINGQPITKDTYIRIMRSDLVLTYDNTEDPLETWGAGIKDFRGHFTYYTNAPQVTHGIANRSPYPLFANITTEGYVNDLNIICDGAINITPGEITESDYSPLCQVNEGHITDCRVISPTGISAENRRFIGKTSTGSCFAGICVHNESTGVITNCACAVARSLEQHSNFAGICKRNDGDVVACVASSPMSIINADNAAGICYENHNIVRDCYCDLHYTTSDGSGETNWGGIVYHNWSGLSSIVRNCYFSSNAIIRSFGNVGGIVCNNEGLVDYCHAERGSLRGTVVGGIVSTVSDGEVRNCYANDSSMVVYLYNNLTAAHSAGGLVGLLSGGTIKNCFAVVNHIDIAAADNSGKIGAVVGAMSGGTITYCYGYSVASSSPTFYGAKSGGTLNNADCFLVKGTQTGVTHVDATDASLGTLCTTLKALHTSNSNDYCDWQRDNVNPNANARTPYLVNPTVSSKQRRHR